MADFVIKAGDTLPEYQLTLIAETGNAQPLDVGVDRVEFRFQRRGQRSKTIVRTATLVDAPNGIVKYVWVDGDTDLDGVYDSTWKVFFTNGTEKSFPNVGFQQFFIERAL